MTTNRPLIAVTPLMDYGRDSLWMLPGYMEAIMRAGGTPVMLPLTDDTDILAQCAERFDAFLFTGGPDVGPMVGAAASATGRSEVLSPERDRMESILLPAVMAWDKPILGICRGIQFINAALRGTLWQDLPDEHPSPVVHHATSRRMTRWSTKCRSRPIRRWPARCGRWETTARSEAEADEVDSFGRPYHPRAYTLGVNSYHHQAIRTLGQGLEPMATAPDSIVEAVWMPAKRFVWAVQWHPEFSHRADSNQRRILSAFIDAC